MKLGVKATGHVSITHSTSLDRGHEQDTKKTAFCKRPHAREHVRSTPPAGSRITPKVCGEVEERGWQTCTRAWKSTRMCQSRYQMSEPVRSLSSYKCSIWPYDLENSTRDCNQCKARTSKYRTLPSIKDQDSEQMENTSNSLLTTACWRRASCASSGASLPPRCGVHAAWFLWRTTHSVAALHRPPRWWKFRWRPRSSLQLGP
jgi:hypothetical protein